MSDSIPRTEAVFALQVTCGAPTLLGQVKGGDGLMIPILGGSVSGERLSGEILPGGADWAIRQADGLVVIDAHYAIKASDGAVIRVVNQGTAQFDADADAAGARMLTSPRFTAPAGPHEWLNHTLFVATLEPDPTDRSTVRIVVFSVV